MHSLSLDNIKTRMPQNLWNEKGHDKIILTETSGRRGCVTPAPVLQAHCSRRDTRVKVVTLVAVVGDLTANSVLVGVKASVANRVRRSTWDRCSYRQEETAEEKSFQCVYCFVFEKEGSSLRYLWFLPLILLSIYTSSLLCQSVLSSECDKRWAELFIFWRRTATKEKNLHWDNRHLQTPNSPSERPRVEVTQVFEACKTPVLMSHRTSCVPELRIKKQNLHQKTKLQSSLD